MCVWAYLETNNRTTFRATALVGYVLSVLEANGD